MIKTFAALLAIVLVVSLTRDIVCQLACAEPDAAHAAAGCHESGAMAGSALQVVQDHCTALDASPAVTAIKTNALQHQAAAVVTSRSCTMPVMLAPAAGFELFAVSRSSRAHCPSVLRI